MVRLRKLAASIVLLAFLTALAPFEYWLCRKGRK